MSCPGRVPRASGSLNAQETATRSDMEPSTIGCEVLGCEKVKNSLDSEKIGHCTEYSNSVQFPFTGENNAVDGWSFDKVG